MERPSTPPIPRPISPAWRSSGSDEQGQMSKESSMASPSPSKNGGPSASAGGAAAELGVIVPYPEEAIARRSFEPVAVPVHPLVRRARSLAAGMLPTIDRKSTRLNSSH